MGTGKRTTSAVKRMAPQSDHQESTINRCSSSKPCNLRGGIGLLGRGGTGPSAITGRKDHEPCGSCDRSAVPTAETGPDGQVKEMGAQSTLEQRHGYAACLEPTSTR